MVAWLIRLKIALYFMIIGMIFIGRYKIDWLLCGKYALSCLGIKPNLCQNSDRGWENMQLGTIG